MITYKTIYSDIETIRSNSPLVHNITNYVVMNNTANALLAIGASPVMAHAIEEVEEMSGLASSFVLNMGTLSDKWIDSMILAGKTADSRNIPIIFDPVGVGATTYRTQMASLIIEQCKPTVIRGNASEIMALTNSKVKTKGVDSTQSSRSAIDSAKLLAKETRSIIVISGPEDYITDGQQVISTKNGSTLMAQVTGMGCTATAVIGAFAAVNTNTLEATANAMAVMSIAGEIAAEKSMGPGTMQMHFLDELYRISKEDIKNRLKLTYE